VDAFGHEPPSHAKPEPDPIFPFAGPYLLAGLLSPFFELLNPALKLVGPANGLFGAVVDFAHPTLGVVGLVLHGAKCLVELGQR
jgi:hypothetical protein